MAIEIELQEVIDQTEDQDQVVIDQVVIELQDQVVTEVEKEINSLFLSDLLF